MKQSICIISLVSLLCLTACTKNEQAPTDSSLPVETPVVKDIGQTYLTEVPIEINYSEMADIIATHYTVEGLSMLKQHFPDEVSIDFALRNLGRILPPFVGETVAGENVSSSKITSAGQPFILVVGSPQCTGCNEIRTAIQDYQMTKSIPAYWLSLEDEEMSTVENLFTLAKNNWITQYLKQDIIVTQEPTILVIDERGKIAYTHLGSIDTPQFRRIMSAVLADKKLYDYVQQRIVEMDVNGRIINQTPLSSISEDSEDDTESTQ